VELHESGQMYLETIHVLLQRQDHVRAIDVGNHLGYSKPSVSRALGLLKQDGYITVNGEGHISLNPSGEAGAGTASQRTCFLSRPSFSHSAPTKRYMASGPHIKTLYGAFGAYFSMSAAVINPCS